MDPLSKVLEDILLLVLATALVLMSSCSTKSYQTVSLVEQSCSLAMRF